MSEVINNREYRKEVLKDIIRQLHNGKSADELKDRFEATFKDVDGKEISLAEQALINEGLPVEEVQRLCDVHAAIFKPTLEKGPDTEAPVGHPVTIFKNENRALEKLINEDIRADLTTLSGDGNGLEETLILSLREKLNLLSDIDKHYSRKENVLFPYLEKYGIMGPPKVMWGVDDELRNLLKQIKVIANAYDSSKKNDLLTKTDELINNINDMIFKEEKILFPMALETLTEEEWYHILEDSDEIGYCLVEPVKGWVPAQGNVGLNIKKIADENSKGHIKFDTGILTPEEISMVFNTLPIDITFVDKEGVVKYFSNAKDRIFPRTRTIIGRKVENCHPPGSVDVVEKLVEELRSGQKEYVDFWISRGDKYVLIRYFAVRDTNGDFRGVLEVSQDIKPLQSISGEKRLMN